MTQVFRCDLCTPELKTYRGCFKPFVKENIIWEIPWCCSCEGRNAQCQLCHGKGRIPLYQCPMSIPVDQRLSAYYNAYRTSNYTYPDGRGRFYQPLKLTAAFDIMGYYQDKLLEEKQLQMEKKMMRKNHA